MVDSKLFLTVATDVLDFSLNIHGHQIIICEGCDHMSRLSTRQDGLKEHSDTL